jgi:uncharacterized protein (DUF58 family)
MNPTNRLLIWTAVVSVPAALWPIADSRATLPCLVGFLFFVVLAAIDAFLAPARLAGLRVELPPVVRLTRDREVIVPMDVHNPSARGRRLRFGIAWPAAIRADPEETIVHLPAETESSRMEWKCTSARRGRYVLDRAFVQSDSRFGFWQVRTSLPVKSELRVYPNLLSERRSLAALFLHRAHGFHTQRQLGKGREFEKLREYVSGDSYDDIHWKATARRGHPITKVFQIERTQQVYVVLDASRLSARILPPPTHSPVHPPSLRSGGAGTDHTDHTDHTRLRSPLDSARGGPSYGGQADAREHTVLERFITSSLILGLAAEQQGDLFGLLAFTDRIETFLRAGHGQSHYGACRDALYTLEPRIVTPDFEELASFIRLRLRRRALLFFLTALDDPMLAENFVQHIDLICHHHLILVNMVRPPGVACLFTQTDPHNVDDIYGHLGGHLRWHNLRELEKILQRRGVRFSLLEHEALAVQLVSRYLDVKQRQLL